MATWDAVKEVNLSYYFEETILITIHIYTYYGTLI